MASEEPSGSGSGSSSADAQAPAPVAAPATAEAPAPETTPAPTDDKASSGPAETKAPAKKTKAKTTKAKAKVKAKAPENVHPDDDPSLWIYTSLTAGNMHIVTATSRLETILRANRVPFKAVDIAVDSRARILWGKRAGKAADGRQRRLPGLVQMGQVLGVSDALSLSPLYPFRCFLSRLLPGGKAVSHRADRLRSHPCRT